MAGPGLWGGGSGGDRKREDLRAKRCRIQDWWFAWFWHKRLKGGSQRNVLEGFTGER